MLELFETNPLGLVRASQAAHAALKAVAWHKDRGYEALDVQFEKTDQGTLVRKDGEPVALMPPGRFSRKALLEQIIVRAQQLGAQAMSHFDQRFVDQLRFAAPYEITHDLRHDLRWIQTTGTNQSSLRLGNPTVDMYEPEQLRAEFRIFLDTPRAHLFLTYGQQYEFRATPLLKDKQPFIYADTYEQLSQKVVQVYNQASESCWDRLASFAWAASRAPRPSAPRG